MFAQFVAEIHHLFLLQIPFKCHMTLTRQYVQERCTFTATSPRVGMLIHHLLP